VLNKPLQRFSTKPLTGFYRNGYCDTGKDDLGKHTIAAEVTDEFLEFSKARGNNLKDPGFGFTGLQPGRKWCLCVSRWKEAMLARQNDEDPIVPKVFLNATHKDALNDVSLEDLQKFAKDG